MQSLVISDNIAKFQGNEWTGNVIAKDGRIHLYTSNPSSPMQIDYEDGSSKTEIFRWIQAFVAAKRLSGSLCFDFMEHPVTGECLFMYKTTSFERVHVSFLRFRRLIFN